MADAEDTIETTKQLLGDTKMQRECFPRSLNYPSDYPTDPNVVGLVSKEKLDIITELKESNSAELTRVQNEWDGLIHKNHHLKAEVDVSHTLVREVCSERDELRLMLDGKQAEIHAEDLDSIREMEGLISEFTAGVDAETPDTPDTPEKSDIQLLRNFADVTKQNLERLAKRAEVSSAVSVFRRSNLRAPGASMFDLFCFLFSVHFSLSIVEYLTIISTMQHIDHQNELIKSLQERVSQLEVVSHQNEETISKEQEVSSIFLAYLPLSPSLIPNYIYDLTGTLQRELRDIIRRQQREIALISSAWYDLQGRLQHNNVTVSRYRYPANNSASGADASKSWLAKQRSIIAASGIGRGGAL